MGVAVGFRAQQSADRDPYVFDSLEWRGCKDRKRRGLGPPITAGAISRPGATTQGMKAASNGMLALPETIAPCWTVGESYRTLACGVTSSEGNTMHMQSGPTTGRPAVACRACTCRMADTIASSTSFAFLHVFS